MLSRLLQVEAPRLLQSPLKGESGLEDRSLLAVCLELVSCAALESFRNETQQRKSPNCVRQEAVTYVVALDTSPTSCLESPFCRAAESAERTPRSVCVGALRARVGLKVHVSATACMWARRVSMCCVGRKSIGQLLAHGLKTVPARKFSVYLARKLWQMP